MIRIYEIRQTIEDSSLLENVYEMNRLTKKIIDTLNRIEDLNMADMTDISIIAERTRHNLERIYKMI